MSRSIGVSSPGAPPSGTPGCPHAVGPSAWRRVSAEGGPAQEDLPGPRRPAVLQSLEWLFTPPLRLFDRYAARYGDVFRVRLLAPRERWDRTGLPLVSRDVVVVSSPAQLRDVFAHAHHELRTGEAHEFLEWYFGQDSVLTLDGERHIHERRLLHSLVRPELLPRCGILVRRAARSGLAAWPAEGVLPLAPMIEELALDAALSVVFGPLPDSELSALRRLTRAGATAPWLSFSLMVHPWLRRDLGAWSPGGKVRRVRANFRAFVVAEIERRGSGGRPPGDDLLAQLIAAHGDLQDLAERQRLLNRLEALLGALETVCPALAWCCLHLGRHPQVMARARTAALDGGRDGEAYLEAVCRESLRLNPPFVGSMRRVAAPVRIGGVSLHPGSYLLPCQYLTHRRAELYPEPHRFLPERFLGRTYAAHEYAPFGGGVRRCIGEALALQKMSVILAELLRAYELRPARVWSGADRRRNSLLVPRDPLPVTVRRGAADALPG